MLKIFFALFILSGTVSLFADDMMDNTTVTGAYPTAREEGTLGVNRVRAGVTTGINSPNGISSTSAAYGITATAQPYEHLGFGFDADTARLDSINRGQRTTAMVNAQYVVGGDVPVLRTSYVGIGGGMVIVPHKLRAGYAPMVGFDVPFDSNKSHQTISLGLTAKYLINPTLPNAISAAAALKYWF